MPYHVILVRPEGAINIGLTARAVKNFGANLILVNPQVDYLKKEALTFAANASDILENLKVYHDLPAALTQTPLSLGFSRRKGQFRKQDMSLPQVSDFIQQRGDNNIALVFGNEQTGLSDTELRCTSLCVNIDTDPAQPSLNLSHAVAIVLQQLFQVNTIGNPSKLRDGIISCSNEFIGFLDDIAYFKDETRQKLFQDYLEKILTRGIKDEVDVLVVKKLLTIIRGSVKRLRTK